MNSTWQIVWASLFGLEALVIICANSMAIRIFLQRKFRMSKSSYLLVNLTVADVLVGFASLCTLLEVVYSSQGLFATCNSPKTHLINAISLSLSIFTLVASLNALALLAFERALAILIPLRFRLVEGVHYIYSISMSWLLSLVVLLKNISDCSTGFDSSLLRSIMTIIIGTDIITIVLSYSAILIKVKYRPSMQVNSTMKKNIKLSKTLMLTTMCALVTWSPRVVISFLKRQSITISSQANFISMMMLYSNSFVNLFVYALRMPAFRREMLNMFKFMFAHANKNRINSEMTRIRQNDVKLERLTPRNESTTSSSKSNMSTTLRYTF